MRVINPIRFYNKKTCIYIVKHMLTGLHVGLSKTAAHEWNVYDVSQTHCIPAN